MIKRITIENYKSIRKLDLELGRLNVFIGENGSGKTNILEAIALGSAAAQDKLSNEFLAPRGIRVTAPEFMHSAFDHQGADGIGIQIQDGSGLWTKCDLVFDDAANVPALRDRMKALVSKALLQQLRETLARVVEQQRDLDQLEQSGGAGEPGSAQEFGNRFERAFREAIIALELRIHPVLPDYLVYSAENSALRNLPYEAQILPLGVKGEGLLDHLRDLAALPDANVITEINEHLLLLDWFESLEVPNREQAGRALRIRDRYLPEGLAFDQRSANEGFLFLLFYFTLFASPHTPKFFAIDNVDASLNPKMCAALMRSMVALAKKHEKQAIVTTHNPSLLDGLDLHDDEQRLFVVQRRRDGSTRIDRIGPPKPLDGDAPIRMSEAFVRGYIGGLPKNF